MARIVQTDDEVSLDLPPLCLTFRRDALRWVHGLSVGGRAVAASLEWEPDRDDPARVVSPAYQQLSTQESAAGPQALLVGQWGQNHGSAVFTLSEAEFGIIVDADIAVRTRSTLEALASTYLVHLTSSDLADAGPTAIVWDLANPPGGRLRFEPAGAGRVGLTEAGRRATRVQATAEVVPGRSTHRLHYRWCWLRNPDQT